MALFVGSISDNIDPKNTLFDVEILPAVGEAEYFEQSRLLPIQCARKYYEYLGQTIIRVKGSCLEKLEEKMPKFFGRLHTLGCLYFADEPIKANHIIASKFYENISETNF